METNKGMTLYNEMLLLFLFIVHFVSNFFSRVLQFWCLGSRVEVKRWKVYPTSLFIPFKTKKNCMKDVIRCIESSIFWNFIRIILCTQLTNILHVLGLKNNLVTQRFITHTVHLTLDLNDGQNRRYDYFKAVHFITMYVKPKPYTSTNNKKI